MKDIIPIGSTIVTKMGGIKAIVIGISIRGQKMDSIEYHVSWFANGEHKNIWLFSFEVDLFKDEKVQAGFHKQKNNGIELLK